MNKVNLLGRLTKDPEINYTNNNVAVAKFSLAVSRKYTKKGEEKQVDFLKIVVFNKLAEFCSNYFSKGQQVAISGRIATRNFDGEDGKKVYITEIIAEDCYFAESKNNKQEGNQENSNSVTNDNDDGFYPVNDDDDALPF
jgi:single-strand DNA-binding protein